MRPGSQNARILDVLADGRPHTTAEIHRRAGFSRLNSRIAELRAQGYPIPPCERTGEGTGPETFVYRLLSEREGSGLPEGGAELAQRRLSTGWSQVAEAPEAETDSGFMAGGRKVVGTASRSESSPTSVPLSAPGSARTESDVSRSTGPGTAVPRAPITEPTQLALEVVS